MQAITDAIKIAIAGIASVYEQSNAFAAVVFSLLTLLGFQLAIYFVVGIFATRKFKSTDTFHKYAIVIAARNEEGVIGNLLDSIHRQDYPSDKLTVFVVADNCTDSTAKVAREKGAVCYERFDNEHRTKGFALQFLFEKIRADFGIEAFEGYFVFDADNLLNSDYITRMNEAFDEGEKIITSYRNTKNFDENWIASTYAIHWLRSVRFLHRARSVLRLATNIQGTGFLFANELMKNGWNYTSLTEDRAFTADAVAHGYPISYCDAAMFYDEQPTNLKIALRQRVRWSKGHFLAFLETGPKLFKNIFVGNCYRDKSVKRPMSKERFIEGVRTRFASYDTLQQLLPIELIKWILWLIISIVMFSCYTYTYGITSESLLGGAVCFNASPGICAVLMAFLFTFLKNVIQNFTTHLGNMVCAIYVFITENKRIIKIPLYKKILYTLTWPIFDAIGRYTLYLCVFKKVEWKPIPHTSSVTIHDIEAKKEKVISEKDTEDKTNYEKV